MGSDRRSDSPPPTGDRRLSADRNRLRRPAEVERVRREGRSWSHPHLVIYAAAGACGRTRVGFAVSRRVGKAVARNRVRRRLREIVRLARAVLKPGFDLVLIARASAAAASYWDLHAAVEQLLRRAGLVAEPLPRPSAWAGNRAQGMREDGKRSESESAT